MVGGNAFFNRAKKQGHFPKTEFIFVRSRAILAPTSLLVEKIFTARNHPFILLSASGTHIKAISFEVPHRELSSQDFPGKAA